MAVNIDSISPHYILDQNEAYQSWMEERLAHYPVAPENLIVEISNPDNLTLSEKKKILELCNKYNMAIYSLPEQYAKEKSTAVKLGETFSLFSLDGNLFSGEDNISSIQVMKTGSSQEFIPYTDRAINWHTDGYYNTQDAKVKSMVLHCANPSAEGGVNSLMDHEIAYILLRNENPEYITALLDEEAMTVPGHYNEDIVLREEQKGPVFSFDHGKLHMRFTARKKHIIWKDNPVVQKAKHRLLEICDTAENYIIQHRLESGQGLICNNVLHKRTAFKNDLNHERLMFRARYYNRIEGT